MNTTLYVNNINIHSSLQLIFLHYCQMESSNNYKYLKLQHFKKLISDAKLQSQSTNQDYSVTNFDLLFLSHQKNRCGINFETFKRIIPQIACIAYHNLSSQQAYRKVILIHFQTLNNYLQQNTENGRIIKLLNRKVYSELCLGLFTNSTNNFTFNKIYDKYFNLLEQNQSDETKIFQMLYKFTMQFQITPYLASKLQIYLIFIHLNSQISENIFQQRFIKNHNKGQNKFSHITYFKFIKFLLIISQLNDKYSKLSSIQKLIQFLLNIQISKGFVKLANQEKRLRIQIDTHQQKQKNETKIQNQSVGRFESEINLQQNILNSLKGKFNRLCDLKQRNNEFKLSKSRAFQLILHSGIFTMENNSTDEYNRVQIQILISKVGKLGFKNFLKLISQISTKYAIPINEIATKILQASLQIETHKNQNLKITNQHMSKYWNILCSNGVEQFLFTIFEDYMDKSKYLTLNKFYQMAKDYELTPNIITKQQIICVYHQSIDPVTQLMDKNLYIKSFILMTTFMNNSTNKTQSEQDYKMELILQTMVSSTMSQKTKYNSNYLVLSCIQKVKESNKYSQYQKPKKKIQRNKGILLDYLN